jgi:hypothetical protein
VLLIIGCLPTGSNLNAQDSLIYKKFPIYIRGSFFYDFPLSFGGFTGVELPLSGKIVYRENQKGVKVKINREWLLSGDLGFYSYKYNNTGINYFQSIGKRHYRDRPWYFEWRASLGLLRTFYDGLVYSVDANGNVKELHGFGRWYALTGFSTGFGYDLERAKVQKPLLFEIQPSLWIQYPYNSFVLPHLSITLTCNYSIKGWNRNIKEKTGD